MSKKEEVLTGILIGDNSGYNKEYTKYEHDYPFGYPWTKTRNSDNQRFIKGTDGYWYNPESNNSGKAVLTCIGDLMGEPQLQNTNKFGDTYFLHPCFKYVRDYLKSTDFVVGNLETTITEITPYAGEWHRIQGKYHCNAPKTYLDALRYAGFDALVNANNHNCDSAIAGLVDTINALDEKGFMHTGTFMPDCTERAIYVKINGIKLAILSYATYFNKLDSNFTPLGKKVFLNEFSAEKAVNDVAEARKNGAEFIISYIHWGKEYTHELIDSQKTQAQQLADAGADYIIGSHSHSLQPYSTVTAKNGKAVPVLYSLGNFLSSETHNISKFTGILQIILEKKNDEVAVKNDYFVPCYIMRNLGASNYVIIPCDITLNTGINEPDLLEANDYIRELMSDIPELVTSSTPVAEIYGLFDADVPEELANKYVSLFTVSPESATEDSIFINAFNYSEDKVKKAVENGAIAIITNKKIAGVPCIIVKDLKHAYCKVFIHLKKRFDVTTVAITGSVGKSVTKEILESIFNDFAVTLASPGNSNTRNDCLLTMQKLRSYHEYYIQEVHEGYPNSASMMSKGLNPQYAVITNIDVAHRENFDSDEAFIAAFTGITDGLQKGGKLIINGDDAQLVEAVNNVYDNSYDIIKFGIDSDDLDFKADHIVFDGNELSFDISHNNKRTHIDFSYPIEKNIYNILAAFVIATEENVPEDKIIASIAKYKSNGINQNIIKQNGFTLMLDCRSAAPVSVVSSIETFCKLPISKKNKRVAVLSDMYLSTDISEDEHRKIGSFAANSNLDYIFCYGTESKYIMDEAVKCGFDKKKICYCETKRDLELQLDGVLNNGDAVLIKAGRRMYLNSTIRKLFGITAIMD